VVWVALGDLALLALAALFPRYVFAFGPTTPWVALACLAVAALLAGRDGLAGAARDVGPLLLRHRRAGGVLTSIVVVANIVAASTHPQGLEVEILHADGARTSAGVHPDFDMSGHDVLRLATTPEARVHTAGFLIPGAVPWADDSGNTTVHTRVVARGTTALALNPFTPIRIENGTALDCGVERLAYLEPRGGETTLTYEPSGAMDYPGLTVSTAPFDLRFHLFTSSISPLAFWWVALARLLLGAALAFWTPLALFAGTSRVARWPAVASRGTPWEALAVVLCAAGYFAVLAPRVEISASGDQAAFVEWADSLERGSMVQHAPKWARHAGADARTLVALAGHFPLRDAVTGTPLNDGGPVLVDDKPVGLVLLVVIARALGHPESGYFVPAVMASLAVLALYAAARAAKLEPWFAFLAAASLALDEKFVHSATLLDPDTAATFWVTSMLFGLLCLERGRRYAVLAGASLGMACLTRYNAALAALLAIPFFVQQPRRIVPFVLGGLPFLATLLVVNTVAYGGPLRFPYREYVAGQLFNAPYGTTLWRYARAFAADASPALWLPFVAYPFLRREPAWRRAGFTLVVAAWFSFFGTFAPWDYFFVRYLLPVYPIVFIGGLAVWSRLVEWSSSRRFAGTLLVTLLSTLWLTPRAFAKDSEPPDASRIAVAWLDHVAPEKSLVFTDAALNAAVHYYTARRRFPVTLPLPRGSAVDLVAFAKSARAHGNRSDWYLLLRKFEVADFRSQYPEMGFEPVRSGSKWALYRITSIAGAFDAG
jgi:hypothetical protein